MDFFSLFQCDDDEKFESKIERTNVVQPKRPVRPALIVDPIHMSAKLAFSSCNADTPLLRGRFIVD